MSRTPALSVLLVVCLGATSCADSPEVEQVTGVTTSIEESQPGSAPTTTGDKSTTSVARATASSTTESAGGGLTTVLDLQLSGDLQVADSSWASLARPYFVYGVEEDDRLNLRSGPGTSSTVIGSIGFTSSALTVYDEVVFVGPDRWSPIVVENEGVEGAGWVNLRFLRPQQGDAGLEFEGSTDNVVLSWANEVSELLWSPERIADFVGSGGVVVSTDTFIGPDDLVLSEDDLRIGNDEVMVWGYEDGSGEPIERTLVSQFEVMQGSTALTSTDVIGIDTEIGWSNTINNLAEAFPGATIIEYHFAGTEDYANLDWTSIRLVFEIAEDEVQPVLVAIVQSEWTI